MSEKVLIYVSATSYDPPNIIDWYPVDAIHEHENCYRIVELNPDPEHLYWQFSFEEIVRCEEHKFAEGEFGLTAVEKCNHK